MRSWRLVLLTVALSTVLLSLVATPANSIGENELYLTTDPAGRVTDVLASPWQPFDFYAVADIDFDHYGCSAGVGGFEFGVHHPSPLMASREFLSGCFHQLDGGPYGWYVHCGGVRDRPVLVVRFTAWLTDPAQNLEIRIVAATYGNPEPPGQFSQYPCWFPVCGGQSWFDPSWQTNVIRVNPDIVGAQATTFAAIKSLY